MLTNRKTKAALYADKSSRQWVVRDPEGNFWVLPSIENSWDHRRPYELTEEAELEPVPTHYKDMLGVPF